MYSSYSPLQRRQLQEQTYTDTQSPICWCTPRAAAMP